MIDKTGAKCDRCPTREEFHGAQFQDIVNGIKRLGWLIKKFGNIWLHYCPTCREKIQPKKPAQPEREAWYNKD